MRRDYKAVLFGNGTMGERHRKFFEYSGVRFLRIFDLLADYPAFAGF